MEIQQLEYGKALIIAKKLKTTPGYVSNVVWKHRNNKNIRGTKAKKILKMVLDN